MTHCRGEPFGLGRSRSLEKLNFQGKRQDSTILIFDPLKSSDEKSTIRIKDRFGICVWAHVLFQSSQANLSQPESSYVLVGKKQRAAKYKFRINWTGAFGFKFD